MSSMHFLPDLSECLAHELAGAISNMAEPCRSRLVSMLMLRSHSELAHLPSDLALWLAGMKPEVMVKQYSLVRQIILDLEQIHCDEVHQ
jgi:hypothetical protein